MKAQIIRFFKKDVVIFVLKTVFYFIILLGLLYLYDYSNVPTGNFIYNDF